MPSTIYHLERRFEACLAGFDKPTDGLFAALDTLPAPIYVTDADGTVVHFNAACIDFTGRKPVVGEDRWCVTWKLYTDEGDPLPHEHCPMAEAIKLKRPISGVTAIAERPDGTRVRFLPHPVPLIDQAGVLHGAVNMLLDITDGRQANALRMQAERCRRLARDIDNRVVAQALGTMAEEYESKANRLDRPL
jgi:PAS domain S-box-containing protein